MNRKKRVLCFIVFLTIAFIFGQSFLNQEMSDKESITLNERVIEPLQNVISGETPEKLTNDDVRNIAHIIEFSLLGFELWLLLKKKNLFSHGLVSLSYCGLIALIDESIQYFSGRGPQVVDI